MLRAEGAGEPRRLGYALPRYVGAWAPGAAPSAWAVLEWLADASGPLCWASLDPAVAAALALREEVLDAGPGPLLGELLVVVARAPRVVVV